MRAGEKGQLRLPWGPQSRCFAPQSLVQGRASGARKKSQGVGAGQSRPLCALRPGTGCGPKPGWHLGRGDPRSAQWGAGQPLPVGRRACLPLSLPPLCRTVTADHTLTFFTLIREAMWWTLCAKPSQCPFVAQSPYDLSHGANIEAAGTLVIRPSRAKELGLQGYTSDHAGLD